MSTRDSSSRAPVKQAKTSDTAAVESTPETPVVGIGASAGGLEAFTRLLGKLQSNTGLAYVLLQHLDPEHKSELPEILGRAANMPVIAAADGMAIEPDHVYVIPPGTATTVLDGHLRVVERERARGVLTLIDAFFLSLAEAQGGVATAVILSGAGSDGSRGIAAIKERGGITIAQDPGSAEFPSMPESAIATGCVDFVMPPEQIADQLLSIGRVESIREAQTGHSHAGQTRAGQAHPGQAHESPVEVTDTVQADIERILILLMRRTGADFRQYRGATVRRRILRRMIAHGSAQYREYLDRVRADPAELDLLGQDILIGVTQFFRDPEAFVAMQQMALPEVLRGLVPGAPVRIWVAGCSSGQEAYSMAILAFEYLSERGLGNRIQIFATDLNEAAIIRARAGLYPHSIERDVTPERLARFFVREDEGYRVTRQVRDLCVFAKHNLLQDPPFSQLDIITCRNVLIYLDAAPQERTMEIFQYALRDTGTLMLGGAESADATYFLPLDKRHRLYRRLPRTPRPLGSTIGVPAPPVLARRLSHGDSLQRLKPSTSQTIEQDADRAVLARLAPPGVVVNSKLEVVQFRGETSPFLQHSPGAASLHLLRLVRPEFLPWLRSAIDRAGLEATVVRHDDVTFHDGELVRRIAIDVIPFVSGGAEERYFAILFYGDFSQPVHPATESAEGTGKAQRRLVSPVSGPDASREIARLVEELSDTKRYLQDVIEQYEAANEELRAAGEEIQSSNEELRSSNEELETTKEEVQSTNEELITVNEELRHRNRELADVSNDLANVFASTLIPIVIVDPALTIRRFTPAIDRMMRMVPSDLGRALGDIKLRFDLPDLEARVGATIATLVPSQADVQDDQGRWWALTVRPYLTVDRKLDGAVLVFTDIDVTKRYAAEEAQLSEHRRQLLLATEAARSEASAANLAKMGFLANMSHDLRTPLNAIAGYADLMALRIHGELTPAQEVDLARITRSARHLLSLINDILNYAKIESGKLNLVVVPVSVTDAMTALEEVVFPQVQARGLSLALHACEGVILADREKLQQILLNLVTNSIKFTVAGGIEVRCSSTDATVRIEVSDTGTGIAADQLDRIFEPFIQVSRGLTSAAHDGVGLGLSISRDLARAMGGDITVQSMLGRGSVFAVTLPGGVE